MAIGRERHADRGGFGGVEPPDVEPFGSLHRHTFATGPLVLLGHREDEVPELAKPEIRPVCACLATIEVDRPATEGDGRRRAALRPDDPGGSRGGAHPGEAPLDDDDATDTRRLREHRRPATDRSGPDHDEIRALAHVTSLRLVRGG